MWFRLSIALGKPVSTLQRQITRSEFAEYCAFYELEPFGCMAEDERWRQHYNLMWSAHARPGADEPDWLTRYPVDRPKVDTFEQFLAAHAVEESEQGEATPE